MFRCAIKKACDCGIYDADGNVVYTTDPRGNSTHYLYDESGRKTTIVPPPLKPTAIAPVDGSQATLAGTGWSAAMLNGYDNTHHVSPAAGASASWTVTNLPTTSGGFYEVLATWQPNIVWTDVQVADFNGDGKADIAGMTSSGDWYVALSNGTGFTIQRWTTWSNTAGWTNVHAADVNGDGKADIVGMTSWGYWYVALSTGTGFVNQYWGSWNPGAGWQDVQVADFNGDGMADIAGMTSSGDWWVSHSTGTSFVNSDWVNWNPTAGWTDVHAADVSGDGKADIVGMTSGGYWYVALSTGTSFLNQQWDSWNPSAGWTDVQVADFNGDGKADIAGMTSSGDWWVGLSTGTSFNNGSGPWGSWDTSADWTDVHAADVNGTYLNGHPVADIVGRATAQSSNGQILAGQWYVELSTCTGFNNQYWGLWNPAAGWQDVQLADFNGDGKADIVGMTSYNTWWAGISTGTSFGNQYLGSWQSTTAASYTVYDGSIARGTAPAVDQQVSPPANPIFTDACGWQSLGVFWISGNALTVTVQNNDGGFLDADAIRVVQVDPTILTYDSNGNVISTTNALNQTTSVAFDALNRQTQVTQPADANGHHPTTQYAYDANGNLLSTTDADDNLTRYVYDLEGRRIQTIDALDDTTTTVYDAVGNVISTTDALGRTTTFQYDTMDRTIAQSSPLPLGGSQQVSTFWLPGIGEVVCGGGPTTYWTYDGNGNVTYITDPLGNTTSTQYNSWNLPVAVTDALGAYLGDPQHTTTTTYDELGRVSTVTDPPPASGGYSRSTEYIYDNLGRKIETVAPDPSNGQDDVNSPKTYYGYDANGNLAYTTDPLGSSAGQGAHTTWYFYDALNRQTCVVDPLAGATYASDVTPSSRPVDGTMTVYDAVGNVASVTDADGNTTTYKYDNLNRQVECDSPVAQTLLPNGTVANVSSSTLYVYDPDGNVTQKTDGDGRITQYIYDPLDRQVEEDWMTSATATHKINTYYDADGETVGVTETDTQNSANATNYEYAYDADGDLLSSRMAPGDLAQGQPSGAHPFVPIALTELDYTYYADGSVLTVTDNSDVLSSGNRGTTTYAYTALGQLWQLTNQNYSGSSAITAKHVEFTYNADGTPDTITRYNSSTADPAKVVATTTYRSSPTAGAGTGYDGMGRLTAMQQSYGSTSPTVSYTWQYDAASNITQSYNSTDGVANNYTLDNAEELQTASFTGENYTYDANGNRTSGSYVTGADNRLLFDGTYDYAYDGEGNRIARWIPGGAGETAPGQNSGDTDITIYTWDYRDRLTQETHYASYATYQSGSSNWVVAYTYDFAGRMIRRGLDDDGSAGPDAMQYTYTVYDGQNPYLQVNGGNGLANSGSPIISQRYLYALAVDQIMATDACTGSATGVLWGLGDNQGTIRDVVDSTGVNKNHVQFNSFGATSGGTSVLPGFAFGEAGMPYDVKTGEYLTAARRFDPSTAQFESQDPIGFASGTTNLSVYCGNCPVDETDPSGFASERMDGKQAAAKVNSALVNAQNWAAQTGGNTPTFIGFESVSIGGGTPTAWDEPSDWLDGVGCDTFRAPGHNVSQMLRTISNIENNLPLALAGKNGEPRLVLGPPVPRDVAALQFAGHGRTALMGINVGEGDPNDVDRRRKQIGTETLDTFAPGNPNLWPVHTPVYAHGCNTDNWAGFFIDSANAAAFADQLKNVRFAGPNGQRPLIILMACNLGISTALDTPGNARSVPQIIANTLNADVITAGGFQDCIGFHGNIGAVVAPVVGAKAPGYPSYFEMLRNYAITGSKAARITARNTLKAYEDAHALDDEHNSHSNTFFYTTPDP